MGWRPSRPSGRDAGLVSAVEVLYLGVVALVAVAFVGYLGRLGAAGVQVTNAAQSAARIASQADGPDALDGAAASAVDEVLGARCVGGPRVSTSWEPSPEGTWRGGSVTARVSCTVEQSSLTGVWTPGRRTIVASDTQPVDRYRP